LSKKRLLKRLFENPVPLNTVVDSDQVFGGRQSNKGVPESLHLFKKTQLLCDNRWVSHKSGYRL